MKTTTKHIRQAEKRKKQKTQKTMIYTGIGIIGIVTISFIILFATNTLTPPGLMGDAVLITSSAHIPNNTPAGPYSSNPPAGGTHYETNFSERFYQESDLATLPDYPEGYLVHSLEHGYVIFWYNCQAANTDCSALKQTIQNVMDETGKTKLIAFPWSSMDVPLAMTSWGRILNFTSVDPVKMTQFVKRNRYHAPEPNAS